MRTPLEPYMASWRAAYYGIDAIRSEWVEKIAMRDEIIAMADRLAEGAGAIQVA